MTPGPMLTIVIPTYERHDRLARALAYWRESPFDVVVADGSRQPWAGGVPANVRYTHDNVSSTFSRWGRAVRSVRTKYVAMCADDDFHGVTALHRCVAFLEANPDHASVQGRYLYFDQSRPGSVSLGYPQAASFAVAAESIRERLLQAMNPFMHQIYAVHHARHLQDAIGDFPEAMTANALELQVSLVSAVFGKHRTLPLFYSARESLAGSAGGVCDQDLLPRWVYEPDNADAVGLWRSRVAQLICAQGQVSASDAEAAFDAAIRAYVEFTLGLRRLRGVRRLLPKGLMSYIRSQRERLTRPYTAVEDLFDASSPQGRRLAAEYDWNAPDVQDDWNRIQHAISPSQRHSPVGNSVGGRHGVIERNTH